LKNEAAFAAAIERDPEAIRFRLGQQEALFQYYNTLYEFIQNSQFRIKIIQRQQRQAKNMIEFIKRDYEID
jgi:hypothetical protein